MAETPSASQQSVVEEQQQHQNQQSEQKSMEEQSSGPGLTWMSLMGALSADDTTKPSTANVKVSCMLDRNGGNFRKWMTEVGGSSYQQGLHGGNTEAASKHQSKCCSTATHHQQHSSRLGARRECQTCCI
jgi:hypothetical protein